MSYAAKVIADSISPDGVRLTTLEVVMPRFILAEFNTHRVFSRNSASSRAIPVERRVRDILNEPFIPEAFGLNIRGMSAGEDLEDAKQMEARQIWLDACQDACRHAMRLAAIDVHKQWANRVVEPFAWHTVVVTATEWKNYYALRISEHAQPEIRMASSLMIRAMEESIPTLKNVGEWHLPYVGENGGHPDDHLLTLEQQIMVSAARAARVSYLTQDGRRDPEADFTLHDRLRGNGHMSPLEHPAFVMESTTSEFIGNFKAPWMQYRKMINGESVFVPSEVV